MTDAYGKFTHWPRKGAWFPRSSTVEIKEGHGDEVLYSSADYYDMLPWMPDEFRSMWSLIQGLLTVQPVDGVFTYYVHTSRTAWVSYIMADTRGARFIGVYQFMFNDAWSDHTFEFLRNKSGEDPQSIYKFRLDDMDDIYNMTAWVDGFINS